jgi:two-component system nitrate/nitrite response regulator NarL
LVLVGAEVVQQALAEAERTRKLWPESKIVLLLPGTENVQDFQQMLASEIDGCVPLSVSQETLIRTIELVMLESTKILVMARLAHPHARLQPSMDNPEGVEPQKEHDSGNGNGRVPVAHTPSPTLASLGDADHTNGHTAGAPREARPQRNVPRLSEREAQVLDSIVRGYSNKIIARKCGITEATVKVHMKSILRKIQVANRTQAAVWAIENSYAIHIEKRLMEADVDQHAP